MLVRALGDPGLKMADFAWILLLGSVGAILFDLHVTWHGAIAALGAAGLIVAVAMLLFLVLPAPLAIVLTVALLYLGLTIGSRALHGWLALMRRPAADALLSRVARVAQPLQPEGWVKLDGVYWRAICPSANASAGDLVLVLSRQELTLFVAPLRDHEAARLQFSDLPR
jgi:membrane-bound ClpP family serine protease